MLTGAAFLTRDKTNPVPAGSDATDKYLTKRSFADIVPWKTVADDSAGFRAVQSDRFSFIKMPASKFEPNLLDVHLYHGLRHWQEADFKAICRAAIDGAQQHLQRAGISVRFFRILFDCIYSRHAI